MSRARRTQTGFTAVELLITLFVAAAFIVAGYQLFNVIIKDGGDTRAQTTAANTAYAYLRQYADTATNPCAPATPLTNSDLTVTDLSDVKITVSIECSQPDTPTLSKVNAHITYNDGKSLTYSTYVDKSKGATLDTDVTDGLIAWWKFNGNAATSAGGSTSTLYGNVTPAIGQNGLPNSAYTFGGTCCNYIRASNVTPIAASATFSAWIYPTAYPSERAMLFVTTPENSINGVYFALNTDGSLQTYRYGASSPGYHTTAASTIPLNQWTLVSVVWSPASVKLFTNGTLRTTVTSVAIPTTLTDIDIGVQSISNARQFSGRMDDLRIYNRALSNSEVTQLYTGGAK